MARFILSCGSGTPAAISDKSFDLLAFNCATPPTLVKRTVNVSNSIFPNSDNPMLCKIVE
jgi:hypothetical protein